MDETLNQLIDSLNNSMEEIRKHPTTTDKLPSNFEIMVRGVSDSKAIDMLFSPKMDNIINGLFAQIQSGNFDKILSSADTLEKIANSIFGEGSFKGPVSQTVLDTLQSTIQSYKYQTMKSHLGKTMTSIKKYNYLMKNLQRSGKKFDKNSQEYRQYKEAIYAIKKVLKFVSRVYKNRKIINNKVWKGLNNIVYEEVEIDEAIE